MSARTIVYKKRDPRLAVDRQPLIGIDQGGTFNNPRRVAAGNFSDELMSFQDLGVNTSYVIDRKMFIEYSYSPEFSIITSNKGDGVVFGTDLPAELRLTYDAAGGYIQANVQTYPGVAYAAGTNYHPAISEGNRIKEVLNTILALCGLSGKSRSVGPRQMGLLQSCTNLQLTINTQTVQWEIGDMLPALLWYQNNGSECHYDFSKCASAPDIHKSYKLAKNSAKNPLASYDGEYSTTRDSRGSFWKLESDRIDKFNIVPGAFATLAGNGWYCIEGFAFEVSNGANPAAIRFKRVRLLKDFTLTNMQTEATVNQNLKYFTFVEPVLSPILTAGQDPSRGLYGVDTLQLSLTLSGVNNRWICGDTKKVVSNFNLQDVPHDIITGIIKPTSSSSSGAYLHYTLLTPQALPELSSSNIYDCKKVWKRKYEANISALANYSTGDISVSSIPERIYVFARKNYEDMSHSDPNTYLRLKGLNFQFQNSGGQLGNCDSHMLYQISKESGLQQSWTQWSEEVGSVFCLDFRRSVNLSQDQYAGTVGNYHINFNLQFEPLIKEAAPVPPAVETRYTIYFVIVEAGIALIQAQSLEQITGMPMTDPLTLPDHFSPQDENLSGMYGGSLASNAKNIGSKVVQGIQTALPYVQKSLPYIEKGMKFLAPLLAAGAISETKAYNILSEHGPVNGKRIIKEYCAGAMLGGVVMGGKSSKTRGGKLTSKKDMQRFLSN